MIRKRYYLGLAVIIGVIGIAALAFVGIKPKDSPSQSTSGSGQQTDEMPAKEQKQTDQRNESQEETVPAVKGSYAGYSEQAFTEASSQTRILFFHAPWCPQCRSLDESIKQQELPDNTVIFKVDYDTNQTLRQKYGVTLQTTLVRVDEKGEKVKSVVAYNNPIYSAVKGELGL